jgi:putative two-component system response regulator
MKKILLADDEANLRMLVRTTLQDPRYRILEVSDGRAVVDIAQKVLPDLLILDLLMPGRSGLEVAAALHQDPRTNHIPIIMLTARDRQKDKEHARALGIHVYLTKPFSPLELIEKVEAALGENTAAVHKTDALMNEDTAEQRAGFGSPPTFVEGAGLEEIMELHTLGTQQLTAAYQQMRAYAHDLKTALENERRRSRELEQAYGDTLMRLVRASRYRDEETGVHIERIGYYTKVVACHVGLTSAEVGLLSAAAPLHDVGKIGVPDAILFKQGPLDPVEWEVMREHTTLGGDLLEGSHSPLLECAREIALSHHERWDGSGYPSGLKGEEIPLSGRIVMLADGYDALRSKRPYKRALDHATACDIILKGDHRIRPQYFDPALLEAFRVLESEFAAIYASASD